MLCSLQSVASLTPFVQVTVIANGFTIRRMDLRDPHNFVASPHVDRVAQEMGWWDPHRGPFNQRRMCWTIAIVSPLAMMVSHWSCGLPSWIRTTPVNFDEQ